jgi:hypothetical protein
VILAVNFPDGERTLSVYFLPWGHSPCTFTLEYELKSTKIHKKTHSLKTNAFLKEIAPLFPIFSKQYRVFKNNNGASRTDF